MILLLISDAKIEHLHVQLGCNLVKNRFIDS